MYDRVNEENNEIENETDNNFEEIEDHELFSSFEPLNEEKVIDDEFINHFEPKDEKRMHIDQFEVRFNPKDEDNSLKDSKKMIIENSIKSKTKTSSFYDDIRGKIRSYLDKLLENYPKNLLLIQ